MHKYYSSEKTPQEVGLPWPRFANTGTTFNQRLHRVNLVSHRNTDALGAASRLASRADAAAIFIDYLHVQPRVACPSALPAPALYGPATRTRIVKM